MRTIQVVHRTVSQTYNRSTGHGYFSYVRGRLSGLLRLAGFQGKIDKLIS